MNDYDTWVRIPRTFLSDRTVTDGPAEIAGYRVALHLLASDNGSCRTDEDGKPIYEDVIVESDYIHPEAIRCELPRSVTLEQCHACHDHLVTVGEIELLEVDENGRGLWSVRRVAALNKARLKDRERKKSERELKRLEKMATELSRRGPTTGQLFPDGPLMPSEDRPRTVHGRPRTVPAGTGTGAASGRHTHTHTTSRGGRSASAARGRPGGPAQPTPTGHDRLQHYYKGTEISASTEDVRTEAEELAELYAALASCHDVAADVDCLADGFTTLLTEGAEHVVDGGDPSVRVIDLEHAVVALWTSYAPKGQFDLRDVLSTGAAFPRCWRRIDAGPELLRLEAQIPDHALPPYFDTVLLNLEAMRKSDSICDEATLERLNTYPAWARREAGRRLNHTAKEVAS